MLNTLYAVVLNSAILAKWPLNGRIYRRNRNVCMYRRQLFNSLVIIAESFVHSFVKLHNCNVYPKTNIINNDYLPH